MKKMNIPFSAIAPVVLIMFLSLAAPKVRSQGYTSRSSTERSPSMDDFMQFLDECLNKKKGDRSIELLTFAFDNLPQIGGTSNYFTVLYENGRVNGYHFEKIFSYNPGSWEDLNLGMKTSLRD